jgi:hypothetical protein
MDFALKTIFGDLSLSGGGGGGESSCSSSCSSHSCRRTSATRSIEEERKGTVQEEGNDHQADEEGNDQQDEEACIKKQKTLGSGLFSNHRNSVLIYKAPSSSSSSSQDSGDSDDETASTVDMDDEDDEFPISPCTSPHTSSSSSSQDSGDSDDETASTVDMDDEDDEFPISPCTSPHTSSSSSSTGSFLRRRNSSNSDPSTRRSVRFEDEIVTSVYTRPTTTKEDKYYLHYDEYDYMDFKLDYRDEILQMNGRRTSRTSSNSNSNHLYYRKSGSRKVSFKRDVVDSIHPVLDLKSRHAIHSDLFYSQNEMRNFLDEFVTSLQQQSQRTANTTTTTASST